MSSYSQVPLNDPESIHLDSVSSNGSKVENIDEQTHCQYCELQKRKLRQQTLVINILLTLSVFLFLFTIFAYSQLNGPTEHRSERQAPALEAIEYLETDFDASMNEFRSLEIDEQEQAWLRLTPLGHRMLYFLFHKKPLVNENTEEGHLIETWAMAKLNRTNLEPFTKVEPEQGDGYIALLEVHVQLGCLNLLRQYITSLEGGYSKSEIPENLSKSSQEGNRMHVKYCIDNLRQNIMCQGDMTPRLVTEKRDKQSGMRLELETHHKCRNFTKLQEWAERNGVEGKDNGE